MKTILIAAFSVAATAALPLAAVANACGGGGPVPANHEFVTPSGNIVCDVYSDGTGVNCEVREHAWGAAGIDDGPVRPGL